MKRKLALPLALALALLCSTGAEDNKSEGKSCGSGICRFFG